MTSRIVRTKRYRKEIFAFWIYIYIFQRKKSCTAWSSGKLSVVILLDLNAKTVLACLTIAFLKLPNAFLSHRDDGSFWHLSSNSTYLTWNVLILPFKQINQFEEWKEFTIVCYFLYAIMKNSLYNSFKNSVTRVQSTLFYHAFDTLAKQYIVIVMQEKLIVVDVVVVVFS